MSSIGHDVTAATESGSLQQLTYSGVSASRLYYRLSWATEFLFVAIALAALFFWKSPYIAQRVVPVWDGGVYLTLAHNILVGEKLYEWFRPLLFSSIVAGIWGVTGENHLWVLYLNLAFTLMSGGVLYYLVRIEKGRLAAFASMMIYVTAFQVLVWSDHLLVHGLTTLCSLLALLALRRFTVRSWVLGGTFSALAVVARYTSVVIVIPIILAFAFEHRSARLTGAAVAGSAVPLAVYHVLFPFIFPNFLRIWFSFGQSTGTPGPWYYYLANWNEIFGIIGFLALLTLLLPSTYRSPISRPWALWLASSMLFFMITTNKQDRFTYEWTPAVAFLSIVGFEAIASRISRILLRAPGQIGMPRMRMTRTFLGAIFAGLLVFQVFTSVNAYLPIQQATASSRDNNLLMVAEYVKANTETDARFISDHLAPDLTFFTGRHFAGIWRRTSEEGFLDYLRRYIGIENARYVIIFVKVTGNSPSVLENSGFLTLKAALDAKNLGKVYIFEVVS